MGLAEKKKELKAPKMRSLESEKTTKETLGKPSEYDARPTLCFTEKELPQVADWKVGEKYMIQIEVEQTGTRICDYGSNKGKIEATFKVSKVGVQSSD